MMIRSRYEEDWDALSGYFAVSAGTNTNSKSKCYSQSETCNELHYYDPAVVVTYGLRISTRESPQRFRVGTNAVQSPSANITPSTRIFIEKRKG